MAVQEAEIIEDTVPLGTSGIRLSAVGVGAWSWGDRFYWGYGKSYGEAEVRGAFDASLKAGVRLIDTAELYGFGRSERLVGRFLQKSGARDRVVIATKFLPAPWRLRRGDLLRALRGSLRRLRLEKVDLYQVHGPLPPVPITTWAEALGEAVEQGLARAVGVSNYGVEQMLRARDTLARRGVPLASNQVAYSLLERARERSGLLEACRREGITLIAYSPLAEGLLTGKYRPGLPPPGVRGRRIGDPRRIAAIQPLITSLRELGNAHGGKTPAQVALNWLVWKGAVPIPGAKNAAQAVENAGAVGWTLTGEEVAWLDDAAARLVPV